MGRRLLRRFRRGLSDAAIPFHPAFRHFYPEPGETATETQCGQLLPGLQKRSHPGSGAGGVFMCGAQWKNFSCTGRMPRFPALKGKGGSAVKVERVAGPFPCPGEWKEPGRAFRASGSGMEGVTPEGLAAGLQVGVDGFLAAYEVGHFRPDLFHGGLFPHASPRQRLRRPLSMRYFWPRQPARSGIWSNFSCAYWFALSKASCISQSSSEDALAGMTRG